MEGTERQLGTRLTDGLGGNHADHFTFLHHTGRREVAAIAFGAHALAAFAGENGTDFDLFDRQAFDGRRDVFGDFVTGCHDEFSGQRIVHIVHGAAAENALAERFDHFVLALDGGGDEAAEGAAVFLVDDDIVRNIHQTARQVAGIRRLEGGIGQTFTGTVAGDEVLEHRHTLFQVGDNRVLDDFRTGSTGFLRLGHQAAHTAELFDLRRGTTGAGIQHHVDGVETLLVAGNLLSHRITDLMVDAGPQVNDLIVTLAVGNQTPGELFLDFTDLLVTVFDEGFLLFRNEHIFEVEGQTALEGHVVTEVLDVIQELRRTGNSGILDNQGNDVPQGFLAEHFVDIGHLVRNKFVDHNTAGRRFDDMRPLAQIHLVHRHTHIDFRVDVDGFFVEGDNHFLGTVEDFAFSLGARANLGDVVQTEHHILGRNGDRRTVGGVEDVVAAEHQQLRFEDGGIAQREVNGHLVTVEVGVESRTSERVQLNGLTLDHTGLESLDTETVQGRSTVEQHGMPFHHIFEDVPDDRILAVHNLLCALDRLDDAALDEFADDEGFVQFGRHILGQTALVHIEFGTHDDDGTGGVVHTFTEQVLTEAALFSFEGVGQGFERAVGFALDGGGLLGVVQQGVNGLLEHTLLVAQNHIRSLDFNQFLEAVVADNHPAVQIVQVGGGETAAIEGNEGTQVGRGDGNHLENHPFGAVDALGLLEPLDDGQALEGFRSSLLGFLRGDFCPQFVGEGIHVNLAQEFEDGAGAHFRNELVGIVILERFVLGEAVHHFPILIFGKKVQLGVVGCALLEDDVFLIIDDGFQFLGRKANHRANLVRRGFEVPDMGHGDGEFDVSHPFATHLLLSHFHTATVADDAAVADSLILSAEALVVFGGAENLLAEESVLFRLVGPVVDGFRLQDFAGRALLDLFRRGERNADLVEVGLSLLFFVIGRHISLKIFVSY